MLTGGQNEVVPAELERVDGLLVGLELSDQGRSGQVPDQNASVFATGRQESAAVGELENVDDVLVSDWPCFSVCTSSHFSSRLGSVTLWPVN